MTDDARDSLPVYKAPEWDDYECEGSGECCHGWVVQVDEFHREKIENALEDHPHPEWGSDIPLNDHGDTNVMDMDEGQCPYLTENNLCWLHREFGAEVKPGFCQEFPRHEIKSPVGIFKIVRFSCVSATKMLTEDKYQLSDCDYPVPDNATSMDPFMLDDETPISAETYLKIEDTILRILDNDEVGLSRRLATAGNYIRSVGRSIELSDPDRLDRISDKYVDSPVSRDSSYPRKHSVIMDSFLNFREVLLEQEKQTQTHHDIQAIIESIRNTFGLEATEEAGETLTRLKKEIWDPGINEHEYLLKRYLKRQLWSKLFTNEFSVKGTLKILTYIFATIRLYAIAQASVENSDLERWHLLNGIVKVEKYFTQAQGLQLLWDRTLNNQALSNQETIRVLCYI